MKCHLRNTHFKDVMNNNWTAQNIDPNTGFSDKEVGGKMIKSRSMV